MTIRITPLADPDVAPSSRRLAWLASGDDGAPLGTAFLRLFTAEGEQHLAELELAVHPAERRAGVGSRLLAAALAGAAAEGRTRVSAMADDGTPGDAFLAARGFRRVQTLIFTRLAAADADRAALDALAARPHPGYRLESWDGTVPDALAETYAASRRAMDDMPTDEAEYRAETWDADRLRAVAAVVAKRGDLLHTVAAVRDGADGRPEIVGFTELVVPGARTGDAQHYGTGVLPEHRGHGLARWMKAESVRHALATHPDLGGLLTDTASSNAPMRAVNDAFGYVRTHDVLFHQCDL